ncbi:unnamed protein product [Paramecium octaurelia]|uniref:WD40-repeat-containing domain n=1 Tax=Paramecium octaurelia TaxID=43137 RepID=A0A8S1S9R7_PAROT|nr:unnamed protein product [Paramecium octaurelia]
MNINNQRRSPVQPQSQLLMNIFKEIKNEQIDFSLIPIHHIVNQYEKKFQLAKSKSIQRKGVLPQLKLSILHFKDQIQKQVQQLLSIIDNILIKEANSSQQYSELNDQINKFYLLDYEPLLKQLKEFANVQKDGLLQIKKFVKKFEGDCINYKIVESLEQNKLSNVLLFNHQNDVFFQGIGENVKIWQFKNGQLYNSQLLYGHNQQIYCLACSKNNNMLVSGSADKSIRIWEEISHKNWQTTQILKGHTGYIYSIIINKSDDQILSSSSDNSILVWGKKQNIWECIQNIDVHQNSVYQLSFNQSYTQFSSCSYDRNLIIWSLNQEQEWKKQQIIKHQSQSFRACFIQDNQIVLQQNSHRYIEIYTRNQANIFVNTQKIELQYLNVDLSSFSPLQFVVNKQILLLKHNNKTLILRRKQNWKFQIEEEIDEEGVGTLTNDGKYLLLINNKLRSLQIYEQQLQ